MFLCLYCSTMAKLLLIVFGVVFSILGTFALDCVHRSYGYSGTVCVCNATYCDNFPPLSKTPKGVITSYVTSLSGDRFHKTQLHFSNVSNSQNVTLSVSLDHNRKYQKIIGFGGAFTDASGLNIAKLPKEMQTRLIRDYFGEDGLEYTVCRLPFGGADYSPRPYTNHEVPNDDNLTKFAFQPEDLNYKIPYINLAKQVSTHKILLFGSIWSAPTWIKTNHQVNHGGLVIGKPGERYYKIFARYFVKFLEEYAKQKIDIWGVTVLNEPGTGFDKNYPFNSLGLNATLERDFVKLDLGPELNASGYGQVKVMIYDDNMRDQLGDIESYVTTVLSDSDADRFVSGIAYHWYVESDRKELERLHQKYPNKFILGTEACELSQPRLGEWSIMKKYAKSIFQDLNHFSTGWVDWNLALDPKGRSHWDDPNNPLSGFNAPLIVNETSHEYYKQPHFYTMGHFSKFIRPDSVRIHHDIILNSNKNATSNIELTVFQRPDLATVLVVMNQNEHSIEFQVHDERSGYFSVNVKANSIETLMWY